MARAEKQWTTEDTEDTEGGFPVRRPAPRARSVNRTAAGRADLPRRFPKQAGGAMEGYNSTLTPKARGISTGTNLKDAAERAEAPAGAGDAEGRRRAP
jgi:hypothetical protein